MIGNHEVVSVINNFVSRDEIDRYTVPAHGTTEPKLPPAAAPALHKLVMQVVKLNRQIASLMIVSSKPTT